MLNGTRGGNSISSGGNAGTSSQRQSPKSASQMCVNTRARSTPPESRIHSRAPLLADAQELAQEQVLGVHRHVGLEVPLPPAGRLLQRQEVVACACERVA